MNIPPELLTSLVRSKEGQFYLNEVKKEIMRLDSVAAMKIDFNNPQAIAVETLARRRAIDLLNEILKPFDLYQEKGGEQEGKEEY